MKKIIIILVLLMGVNNQADAQFLKKLGNAIDKAAQKVDKAVKKVDKAASSILGEPNSSNQNNKKAQKTDNSKQAPTQTQQTTQTQLTTKSSQQMAPVQQNVKQTAATPQQEVDNPMLIKDCSFAGISLGMKMNQVPKSVPGIYDKYIAVQADCSEAFSFYCVWNKKFDGTNPEIIVSDDAMDKLVDGITVFVKGVKIAGTEIEIGAPISKVKNTPGVVEVPYSNVYEYKDNYMLFLDDSGKIIEYISIHKAYGN